MYIQYTDGSSSQNIQEDDESNIMLVDTVMIVFWVNKVYTTWLVLCTFKMYATCCQVCLL